MTAMMRTRLSPTELLFLLLLLHAAVIVLSQKEDDTPSNHYQLIGVSGGLQEGFPAHCKLHYSPLGGGGEKVKPLFLGQGFVRGYKAFLDLMEPTHREYSKEPAQPTINPNVFASGCHEHANIYWLYFVDTRQVMSVLTDEPRFLSLTPDTGTIELNATETHNSVRKFFTTMLQGEYPQLTNVAIPLVTGVYFQPSSHIPSPPIGRHSDGTLVTNYPDSLAQWAGVNDKDRTAVLDMSKTCAAPPERSTTEACKSPSAWTNADERTQRYWDGMRKAIRNAEKNRATMTQVVSTEFGGGWNCKSKTRFGVDDVTSTRVNSPFEAREIATLLKQAGHKVDFDTGEILQATTVKDSLEEEGVESKKDEL